MTKLKAIELARFLSIVIGLVAIAPPVFAIDPTTRLDFDGDGKTDIAMYRRGVLFTSLSYWRYIRSSDGVVVETQWGLGEDQPVPGDYNNDGLSDRTVFRPSLGNVYIINEVPNSFRTSYFGISSSYKMARRYFSFFGTTQVSELRMDNVAEDPDPPFFVWNYYIQTSDEGFLSVGTGVWSGAPFSKQLPAPGDYDGNGFTDVGVFDYANNVFHHWLGPDFNEDVQTALSLVRYPAPGDYDGDGKTDIAGYYIAPDLRLIWRYKESQTGNVQEIHWGTKGDIPVPGYYDSDNKTDFAVYRPSTNTWWILKSLDWSYTAQQFGIAGDIPLAATVMQTGF